MADHSSEIVEIRVGVTEQLLEIDALLHRACRPKADARAAIVACVEAKAASWKPGVSGFAGHGARSNRVNIVERLSINLFTEDDVDAALCALFPEQVTEALSAKLDAHYAVHEGFTQITEAERDERLQRARERLYDLEQTEEQLIVDSAADGQVIPRRAEASVHALLGLPLPPLEDIAA